MFVRRLATAAGILAAIAVAAPAIAQTAGKAPQSEEDKTLYFLGTLAARNLAPLALSEKELAVVQSGMRDALAGRAADLDPQTYGPRVQALMEARVRAGAEEEKAASAAFLASEAAKPGVRKLDSGLLVTEVKAGTGDQPTVNDTIVVHYHGTLRDGTVFDSSVERGEPFRTQLSRLVPCWQEGVLTMRVGGKSRLVCPSDLAYGDAGAGPVIKGGAALVFDIELLEIVK